MEIQPGTLGPKFLSAYRRLIFIGLISSTLVLSTITAVAYFSVIKVIDGDSVRIEGVPNVRLLQIDTPEIREQECYAIEAKRALQELILGFEVTLEIDPKLSQVDLKNGRITRYLFVGDKNINLELVRIGAAAPWFFGGKGMYAEELRAAALEAKANKLGLWGACPGTKLNTSQGVKTGKVVKASPTASPSSSIESYVDPGSYCVASEKGQERLGKNGTKYTCKVSETENRLRWRK